MDKYIAVGSVGHFLPGDEIKGLNADRIQALLKSGAIKLLEPEEAPAPDPKIAALEKQVTDWKAKAEAAEKEVTELKAEVAALKKAAAAEKKAAITKEPEK